MTAGAAEFEVVYPELPPWRRYAIGLAVMTWNRPRYLRKCLRSLTASRLPDTLLLIVDDASDLPETRELVARYAHPDAPVIKARRRARREFMFHENLRFAWDLLSEGHGCRYLANLDSDMVVRRDWLRRLFALHAEQRPLRGPLIVSGFHSHGTSVSMRAVENHRHYRVKADLGGCNMLFDAGLYRERIRQSMQEYWDDKVCKMMQERRYPMLVTRPSVAQHIGRLGQFAYGPLRHDRALDYSKWALPVSLVRQLLVDFWYRGRKSLPLSVKLPLAKLRRQRRRRR